MAPLRDSLKERLATFSLARNRPATDRPATQSIPSTGCKVAKTAGTFPATELYDEIVTVQVGPTKKEHYLHRGLVCHYSTYFQGALRGDWKESKEGIITLDNEDEMTFQKFVDWLYTGRLPHSQSDNQMTSYINLWIFGDRRGVADLQNDVIDSLIDEYQSRGEEPSPQVTQECYDTTLVGSPLRKALVDCLINFIHIKEVFNDEYETEHGQWPRDFCREVAIAVDAKFYELDVEEPDKCDYHVH